MSATIDIEVSERVPSRRMPYFPSTDMPNIITKYARDGRASFQAVVRVDKARPIKKTFPTYEEAEEWRATKDAELRALLETPAYEFSLAEVVEDYTTLHPATVTPELTAHLNPAMALPLSAVGVEYVRDLAEDDLDTVQDIIEHARRYMGVLVPENIVVALRAKREGLTFRPITAWEESSLLAGAKGLANDSLQDILILALDTALVQQEILDLEQNQVNLEAGIIRMSPTRIIPLSTRAKTVLSRRLADNHEKVFPNAPKNTVQTAFIRLKNKLGYNGPDFNDIRKIAIVRLSEKMSIHELKDLLGYQRYTSLEWLIALQKG